MRQLLADNIVKKIDSLKRAVATALLTLKRRKFGGQSFAEIPFDTVNINSNRVPKIIFFKNYFRFKI